MTLIRGFKETVNERVQRDPKFAIALLDEVISLFLNGEPETARLILQYLFVEEQSWQIQRIESAILIADSEEAVWVDGEIVESWLNSWGTESEKPML